MTLTSYPVISPRSVVQKRSCQAPIVGPVQESGGRLKPAGWHNITGRRTGGWGINWAAPPCQQKCQRTLPGLRLACAKHCCLLSHRVLSHEYPPRWIKRISRCMVPWNVSRWWWWWWWRWLWPLPIKKICGASKCWNEHPSDECLVTQTQANTVLVDPAHGTILVLQRRHGNTHTHTQIRLSLEIQTCSNPEAVDILPEIQLKLIINTRNYEDSKALKVFQKIWTD